MTKKLTYLTQVTEAVEKWVTLHGAYLDKSVGRWVVEGDVPPELESYVEKVERVRNHLAESTPQCELCGCQMLLRSSAYGEFWGCSAFPRCKGKSSVVADNYDLCTSEHALSYVEESAVEFSSSYTDPIHRSVDIVEKPPTLVPKSAELSKEQANAVERAQEIYDRATMLFGSRKAALAWLTSKKVGLSYKPPIDVMRTTNGCDLVEKLLDERFEGI